MSYENGWLYFRWVKPPDGSRTMSPEMRFFSLVPSIGGTVEIRDVNGITPKPIWVDPDMVVQAAWPVVLDSAGSASIYMPPGDLFHLTVKDWVGHVLEVCNYVKMPDWRG